MKTGKVSAEVMVRLILAVALGLVLTVAVMWKPSQPYRRYAVQKIRGQQTVPDVLARYGDKARQHWSSTFEVADIAYPPDALTLIVLKEERLLEVWAETDEEATFLRGIPILAASGKAGPKLKRGDLQVPEGIYSIEGLNPNSSYHLSIQIDYPNSLDRKMAKADGRSDLGGLIFIHGGAVSIGCVAVGDEAIEELFVLVAETDPRNVTVIVAPRDLRTKAEPEVEGPDWTDELYREIRTALREYTLTTNERR